MAWTAVILSVLFSSLWAFWGIIENFHEGWYYVRFWDNVAMMFVQYLFAPILISTLGIVSVQWPKWGAMLHVIAAGFVYSRFGNLSAGMWLLVLPILVLAGLYFFGRMLNKKPTFYLLAGLPLVLIITLGSWHGYRVFHRHHDGITSGRFIEGNGVKLYWAPEGPGWPDTGTNWEEAMAICAHLRLDGLSLSDTALNLWRLPTVEEAVRSQVYHGIQAGGTWDDRQKKASYTHQPDKESPLWDGYKKTIYWWTATEIDSTRAYMIVYNGGVWPRNKSIKADYINFRAVRIE